jgi:UDP-N-acetylmuramate dehydrogenase
MVFSQYIEGGLMTRPELQVQQNVPLAPLTTLGVGGSARYLCAAKSIQEIEQAVDFARDRRLEVFVLGGGSNVVVADQGFDGLVLSVAILGIEESSKTAFSTKIGMEEETRATHTSAPEGLSKAAQRFQRWESQPLDSSPRGTTEYRHDAPPGQVYLDVGAGVNWDEFVAFCVSREYGGIECLSGIPGSVGGTPVQNVGAYGQEVSETIKSVLTYDLHARCVRQLGKDECGFAYRSSIFNTAERGRYIILRVRYELKAGAEPALRYADLQKYFAGVESKPSLSPVREAVLKIRASKGMVIDPNDPDSRSAGSFFKNPVLSREEVKRLSEKAAARGLRIPSYPALAQQSKVSAAWLVESSGFHKGYVKGRVGISNKHTLAIVNRGGANATEVLRLRDEILSKVKQTWSVELQTEPVLMGF